MIRRLATAASLAALLAIGGVSPAHAAGIEAQDVVVKLDGATGPLERARIAAAMGGSPGLVVAADTFVVDGARTLAPATPGVRWVAPDTGVEATRVPNDPCYLACPVALDGQSELATVRAADAWDVTTGSAGVVVAVLDNAADAAHADLAGKVTVAPSFVTSPCTNATRSEASHGTAVAGLVGANTGNGSGIAALGWSTKVLSVPVLDPCGGGSASEVAAGVRYAVDRGVDIVNLSLAGAAHPVLSDAVRYAQDRGVLVVAAAGNTGSSSLVFPAAYDGVIGVGSTTVDGASASTFSAHGSWVDLVAPGESMLSTSTLTGGYAVYEGTSFASPLVAAAAALVLAANPSFTAADIATRLTRTAGDGPGSSRLLDAAAAVERRPGGYVLTAGDGGAFTFGDAVFRGSAGAVPLNEPIVAAATDRTRGYWFAAADGGVFAYGVPFLGSMGGTTLNQPIVGMASTPSGAGYWLVARDGGVFSFGDARFQGSTGAIRLNQPIVGMARTPSGAGYWLVASDGGIFAFGDARFSGSTGAIRLASPVVGMAAASASSYWLAAADGGVFTFGGAAYLGGGVGNAGPGVVGIAPGPGGRGYYLARADGVTLPFGSAVDAGSTPPLQQPVVAVGSTSTS